MAENDVDKMLREMDGQDSDSGIDADVAVWKTMLQDEDLNRVMMFARKLVKTDLAGDEVTINKIYEDYKKVMAGEEGNEFRTADETRAALVRRFAKKAIRPSRWNDFVEDLTSRKSQTKILPR